MNKKINEDITAYLEKEIMPRYDAFDKGHQQSHIRQVMESALYLSGFYDVDKDMVLTAAAFHDLGIYEGREKHHLVSGRIIRETPELSRWFSPEQIETIAQAAEDHRASSGSEPRTIYGKIIAEADRQIVPETVLERCVQYGLDNFPGHDREWHWQRVVEHLHAKYAEGGYLKLWIPESPNAARLAELRAIIADKAALRIRFDEIFDRESQR